MAAAQGKVIITCAVTGVDPHADDVAAPAGHAGGDRRGGDRRGEGRRGDRAPARAQSEGRQPDAGPRSCSASSCRKIKAASDVVINITTGGAPTMTVEERLQPALQLKPEVASLNMGSMNFGLYEMLGALQGVEARLGAALPRRQRRPHLQEHLQGHRLHPASRAASNDTRFEIECYDIGHLYTAAHFLDRGLVKPPLFIQSVFGIRGGIGAASRGRDAHEAHRRPPVRRRLPLVGARRRAQPDVRSPRSRR